VIPHTAPPVWPEVRPGRFASAVYHPGAGGFSEPFDADRAMSKCRVGLLGLPDDTGIALNHGRTGAREGPHAFRVALAKYGSARPMDEAGGGGGGQQPAYPRVYDAGDIVPGRDLAETHERVTQAASAIIARGLLPVAIGGGHDLTFPFVRASALAHGALDGLYLDAHLDVRAEAGSGMPFRALLEGGHAERLTVVGLDPLVNTPEHLGYFLSKGGRVGGVDPSKWAARAGRKAFVSIDLDSIDMGFAPGVSAMNPCGLTPREAGDFAEAAGESASVVCFDLMELSPPHDEHGRTARLAAHLFLRFLRGLARRGGEGAGS
jgi:formiminoglutamase